MRHSNHIYSDPHQLTYLFDKDGELIEAVNILSWGKFNALPKHSWMYTSHNKEWHEIMRMAGGTNSMHKFGKSNLNPVPAKALAYVLLLP